MTDHVTCDECRFFKRDDINPSQGLGYCPKRRVANYPMAPHYCRERQEHPEERSHDR